MAKSQWELFDAIRWSEWNEARRILLHSSTPQQQVEYHESGLNALHWACYCDAPADVWQSLLAASPDAPTAKSHDFGQTPLHTAIQQSSDEDKISKMIEACPRAVMVAENWGWTPLHLAVKYKSREIIQQLLSVDESAVTVGDRDGNTPLHFFFRNWEKGLSRKLDEGVVDEKSCSLTEVSVTVAGLYGRIETVREIYESTVLLLRAAVDGRIRDVPASSFLPLHGSIAIPYCPCSFVRMLLAIHPDQSRQQDSEGNFPLHTAAIAQDSEETFHKIEILLSRHPETMKFPNADGKLALHLAIERGKFFCTPIVKAMYQAAPRALLTRDVGTHMHSFMLAALKFTDRTKVSGSEDDEDRFLKQFTSCFVLLVEEPNLVALGFLKRDDHDQLKRK